MVVEALLPQVGTVLSLEVKAGTLLEVLHESRNLGALFTVDEDMQMFEILGLTPKDGMVINGDLGFLQGVYGATSSRLYWSNKSAGINADLPSEAELAPSLWGTWKIQAQ